MSKYAHIYPPLINRVYAEEQSKRKTEREREKAVKTVLHRVYGSYLNEGESKKTRALFDKIINAVNTSGDTLSQSEKFLSLHASTRERLPYLAEFFAFIAETLNRAESAAPGVTRILDIGCGYNPFAIPWMRKHWNLKAYYAYDIDVYAQGLINAYFAALGLPETAGCIDLAAETPRGEADIAFLFKLLPVLEAQKKGRGSRLINELNSRYIVVTFPLKSLGGKNKGMEAHYAGFFETALKNELAGHKLLAKEKIYSELVYILASHI